MPPGAIRERLVAFAARRFKVAEEVASCFRDGKVMVGAGSR